MFVDHNGIILLLPIDEKSVDPTTRSTVSSCTKNMKMQYTSTTWSFFVDVSELKLYSYIRQTFNA